MERVFLCWHFTPKSRSRSSTGPSRFSLPSPRSSHKGFYCGGYLRHPHHQSSILWMHWSSTSAWSADSVLLVPGFSRSASDGFYIWRSRHLPASQSTRQALCLRLLLFFGPQIGQHWCSTHSGLCLVINSDPDWLFVSGSISSIPYCGSHLSPRQDAQKSRSWSWSCRRRRNAARWLCCRMPSMPAPRTKSTRRLGGRTDPCVVSCICRY